MSKYPVYNNGARNYGGMAGLNHEISVLGGIDAYKKKIILDYESHRIDEYLKMTNSTELQTGLRRVK